MIFIKKDKNEKLFKGFIFLIRVPFHYNTPCTLLSLIWVLFHYNTLCTLLSFIFGWVFLSNDPGCALQPSAKIQSVADLPPMMHGFWQRSSLPPWSEMPTAVTERKKMAILYLKLTVFNLKWQLLWLKETSRCSLYLLGIGWCPYKKKKNTASSPDPAYWECQGEDKVQVWGRQLWSAPAYSLGTLHQAPQSDRLSRTNRSFALPPLHAWITSVKQHQGKYMSKQNRDSGFGNKCTYRIQLQ